MNIYSSKSLLTSVVISIGQESLFKSDRLLKDTENSVGTKFFCFFLHCSCKQCVWHKGIQTPALHAVEMGVCAMASLCVLSAMGNCSGGMLHHCKYMGPFHIHVLLIPRTCESPQKMSRGRRIPRPHRSPHFQCSRHPCPKTRSLHRSCKVPDQLLDAPPTLQPQGLRRQGHQGHPQNTHQSKCEAAWEDNEVCVNT